MWGEKNLNYFSCPVVQTPRLTVSPSWLSPGAVVTLRCEVEPQSAGRRFYWYKAVPDLSQIKFRYDLLPASVDGTVENSFVIHEQKHTAAYAYAHPAASLTVSPVRDKLFTFDEVGLHCTGNSAEWRVMRIVKSSYSNCSVWGTMTGPLCTFKSRWLHKAVYWCESRSGKFSNAVNITIDLAPLLELTVSPSWLIPGTLVNLSCEVDPPSDGWMFYWYKAVPDLSRDGYRYELLPDNINGTRQHSLVIHGQNHTAGYACRVGYGIPEFLSRYSKPKFVCSPVSHPAASLSVSPDREQHFTSESVTLSCGGNSGDWRVKVTRELGSSSYTDSCSAWGAMNGSLCAFSSPQLYKAAFWCESESGELSNAVNITVQGSHPTASLTVSPTREKLFTGDKIQLKCSGSSGVWRVRRFRQSSYNSDISDCFSWGTMSGSSCTFSSRWQLTAVYWCESGLGQLSNAINITIHATPKIALTVSTQWASPGASVTLRCEVKSSLPGWRFYWYKAVPQMSNTYKYYLLPEKTHESPRDSYVVHDSKHTTGYACRAGWGVPQYFTNYSEPKIVWSADSHPEASLTVSPDRDIYTVDEVQLTCRGSSSYWKVRRFRPYYQSDVSDCSVWGKMTRSSCTFISSQYHKAVYWCESGSGELSNAVNITVNSTPKPVLTVSTSWPSPGASVTLSCEVKPSSTGWRFYWYKAVPDLKQNNYRYKLLSDGVDGTALGSHVIHGEMHTVVYACRARREKEQYFTEYSEPNFVWSADPHQAASLTVSPARDKLYIVDDIQLKCTGNSADWRVRRFRQSYYKADLSDCSSWGKMIGPLCTFSNPLYHRAVYWCESGSGEFSNAVNISMESALMPHLTVSLSWLSPGASVTLTCEVKPSSVGLRFYWYKAVPDLSKNGYKYDPLPGITRGTVENVYVVYGQKHTAGYACRGGKGNPEFFTEYSKPNIVWSAASNPEASLIMSPNRNEIFADEKIQLSCIGRSPNWRVNRLIQSYYRSDSSNCTVWGKMTRSSCTFTSSDNDKAVYWCESESGKFSNAINITLKSNPRPQLTVSPSWLNPGASVTLSCEVEPPSAGWRFYWYKAVPGLSSGYTYDLLPDSVKGTVQDSYVVHGQKRTVGYACRAGIGNPEIFTNHSEPKIVWSADSHPAASLTVSPARDKLYIVDDIQLKCTGISTDWRVKRVSQSYDQSDVSDCSSWGTMTGSSCTFTNPQYHSAVYWCESESGEYSNAVNITLIHPPQPTLFVSSSWLSPGASVTLRCEVKPSSVGWRFYWYKAVPDLSQNYKYDPLPDITGGTVENVYVVYGQKHTAGLSCRGGKGNPAIFTKYSEPRFVWSAVSHPAAYLTVSPARDKLYIVDDIQLKCTGNSADWRVRRIRQSYDPSDVSDCSSWGTMTESSCTFSSPQYNVALYWCESESGDFSNAVNITVQDENLLLVSPVHPVTEGASVTLSCIAREENQLSNVIFYHNDKLRQNDSRGELKISAVSQSDEGFYKCEHSGEVSLQSWVGVKAGLKRSSSSFHAMWAVGPLCGILLLLLLLLLIRFIRLKGTSYFYDVVRPTKNPENDSKKDQSISYSLLNFKNTGNMRHYLEPDDSPVNSDVRVGAAGRSSLAASDAAVYSEVKSTSGY
ncbi:obscurin-like [Poecilia reticulata]|uniref:obscurin-like n=1 Tax=Poecilia reticulata TaxID=8081 RepID=UPI0007EBB194|nr:PREDICTED: obscurin-like [Poecilia reticulata]